MQSPVWVTLALLPLWCRTASVAMLPRDGRVRPALPHCAARGRSLIAFGAHTDHVVVQRELERVVASARRFACPPHDVVLFVDGSRRYDVLRHPEPGGRTVRVPFAALLKNGSSAFRAFVSHQLLMAAVPAHLERDKAYESVWVIEEDARFFGGDWAELFGAFNESSADLVAHARKTNRGVAALMAVARVSTRLLRAVLHDLAALEAKDDRIKSRTQSSSAADANHRPKNMPNTAARKTIHGAFVFALCARAKWCSYERIDPEWLAVFRAKCPWSARMYADYAASPVRRREAATPHGRIFHPVKAHAVQRGRDFKRFHCKKQFEKEAAPPDPG